MLGDVGLEHLPNLSELEHLKIGATLITGLNLNFLKLLPKLKTLSLRGVQRRNAGACWTPNVTDLDLDTISLLVEPRGARPWRRHQARAWADSRQRLAAATAG